MNLVPVFLLIVQCIFCKMCNMGGFVNCRNCDEQVV